MKRLIGASIFVLLLGLYPGSFSVRAAGNAGFDKMKTLAGEWETSDPGGKQTRVSYRLVSDGTALLETIHPPDESEMISVYHPDGDRLAMTHYCDMGNQPRMETGAVSGDPKELSFAYIGATNLPSPDAGHMHHLTLAFQDNDHVTATWTWRENGKDQSHVFQLTRKK